MNIRIAPTLLLSLLLTVSGSVVAQTPFTDNFEDPAINPFWIVVDQAGSGSVNLDTASAHSGKQSVQVNTDSFGGKEELSHSFPSPLYGTVSVWVYYSNTNGTGYKQLDIYDGPAFSGTDYLTYIDWGDLQTYVRDGSGATTLLAPPQSTGWHNWTFSSMPSGVTIEIDGVQVFTQSVGFAFQTVNLQQCCLSGSAFFDDFTFTPATACQATATAVKMFDSHDLEIDVTGQFSANPLTSKSLSVDTTINGVPLNSVFPLPSGSTGAQAQSLFIDLAASKVPRFTDNAKFDVTARMTENGATCAGTPKSAVVLLPVIVIPGIFSGPGSPYSLNFDGGDGTFPELEAFLKNVFALSPDLGQSYQLQADQTGYPTLYTLNYRTAKASFSEGAVDLNGLINRVQTLTYADQVNLLTHSKGGLVAREYISGGVFGPASVPVRRLIMAEPPNLGALKASWDSYLLELGISLALQRQENLHNLLPLWPWQRPVSFLPFFPTPDPELTRLNSQPMPTTVEYWLIYSTSEDTHWTRTGLPGAFFFSDTPGDGIVPAFSMFGLKPDPNNPSQPPVLIDAFQGITINAIEIDGVHSEYIEKQNVMSEIGALLTK